MIPRTREWLIGLAVGVICTLIAMALIEIVGAQQSASQPIACMAPDMAEKVRTLSLEALDEAFKDRVMRLYEVWTSDPRDQPGRAATGTRNAIRAYVNSRRFMEQWNPPACS